MRAAALVLLAACGRVGFDIGVADDGDVTERPCTQWSAFDPPVLNAAVSTPNDDWSPALSPDGRALAFSDWRSQFDIGIVLADANGGFMSPPTALTGLDDPNKEELEPAFTVDGSAIVFRVSDLGTWVIAMAPRIDGTRVGPYQILFGDPDHYNNEPELSADGLRIYFGTNNYPPTDGHGQIAVARRASTAGAFGPPEVFLELEPFSSGSPTLSRDELEMFFASDRGTSEDSDVWRTTRSAIDQPFGAPTAVAELNTPQDESGPSLSIDGTTLYYNRGARIGGGGNADVWSATRTCLAR